MAGEVYGDPRRTRTDFRARAVRRAATYCSLIPWRSMHPVRYRRGVRRRPVAGVQGPGAGPRRGERRILTIPRPVVERLCLEVELHLEAGETRRGDVGHLAPHLRVGGSTAAPGVDRGIRDRPAVLQRRIRVEHVEDVSANVHPLPGEPDVLAEADVKQADAFTVEGVVQEV